MATTKGIARPNACGQAITITVTIRSNAYTNGNPRINQTANVPKPMAKAMYVNHFAALSERFCIRDFVFCASSTILMTLLR